MLHVPSTTLPVSPIITVRKKAKYADGQEHTVVSHHSPKQKFVTACNKTFWSTVEMFKWVNKSDGIMDIQSVLGLLHSMNSGRKQLFKKKYMKYYERMDDHLCKNDLYLVDEPNHKKVVISHIIAMGKQVYKSCINDITLVYFMVNEGECQSFDCVVSSMP